jgi:hypothetical protein
MAGLLDYLYDPSTYGGNGGLLSRIAPSLGMLPQSQGFPQQDQQFTPSGRTFDAATFDPATYAPNQAQPIAIGGYQMPRIGGADLYQPQQAMLPPNATPTQGQMPAATTLPEQPSQATLPQFMQADQPGFMAAHQNFRNGGGVLSSIIAGLTGQRSDPVAVQQQNIRAQYEALAPIVGPKKAMLAVMNPEAGKTILAQALEKQQPTFGVIGEADGGGKAYGFIDPTKKTVTPYTMPGSENRGTVTGPDGKEIPIPPGVDAKTFRNHVSAASADAATGKKTEVQAKSEKFANKMENAEKNLQGLDGEYTGFAGGALRGTEYLGGVGVPFQSNNYQKYKQARDNFITALLRDESGAAIGTNEFNRYERELFPQPGEGPDIVAQKAQARRVAIEAMKKSAGPGYKSPDLSTPPQAAASGGFQEGATATNPQTGQKLTFRNGKWQ